MSSYIERFRDFVRYTHPYTWATRVASFGLVATLLFGLVFLVPKADAGSIQADLTIIAGILGVVLGAVLVVTVLLIEQRQQAEEHLRCVLPKYRRLIESSIDTVNAAREELVERVRGGKIQLDAPALVSLVRRPSSTKFRDLATAVSALTFTFSEVLVESKSQQVEDDLTELGYSNDEMIDIVYV